MKKQSLRLLSACVLMFSFLLSANLAKSENTVTLKNAPVLFLKNKVEYQQVVVNCKSDKSGRIKVKGPGTAVLEAELRKGGNSFLIDIPAVKSAANATFRVTIDDGKPQAYALRLVPPKKWEVYLVQHSHTDIGYTRPQSEILAEHQRYIDYALDYCDKTDQLPDDAKFRWTCESAWVVKEYLRTRPSGQVERLKKRIAEGRIEVTGMFCNMAETSDEDLMTDFLKPLQEVRGAGIPVKMVMQNDVNGIAWCLPDYFKNTGVRYLNMGINSDRSILPFSMPTLFWWKAPSGEKLLAFRADHYMTGNFMGFESSAVKPERLLEHLADLAAGNFPADRFAIQFSGYFTDNAPPSTNACRLVKEWNEKYAWPKLRLAVASEFFEYVAGQYADKLPVYQKAWLDWWTDGTGSASRETAEVRKTQNLKQVDEGLFAMVALKGGELDPATGDKINHIAENAIFYDEHTFGADESISHPFSENTARQWLQKGAYAWEAVKMQTLLHEEALARLQPFLKTAPFPVIHVINSLGWTRSGTVNLFIDYEILPATGRFRIVDLGTGQEVPSQLLRKRAEGAYWSLEVRDVPALGIKTLKIEESGQAAEPQASQPFSGKLENEYYRIVFDASKGAISSLFDKELNRELIDAANPWMLGQVIRETFARRNVYDLKHSSVTAVKLEQGEQGAVWESIRIGAEMDGLEPGTGRGPKGLEAEVRLYKHQKKIEFRYTAHKQIITTPEGLYVAFPFSLPGARVVFETIGGTLSPGGQIPGSSSDWNAAQTFVAARSSEGQVVVVSDELPLWHFGGLNMGKYERYPGPCKPLLYSWVMNNYWTTNFRAYQEGGFTWSYQLTSSKDTTNTFASRFGRGVRNIFPTRTFPAGKAEQAAAQDAGLRIGGAPGVMLVNSRPVFGGSHAVILHFREMEGKEGEISLESTVAGKTFKSLEVVNALGEKIAPTGKSLHFNPFEVKFILVSND